AYSGSLSRSSRVLSIGNAGNSGTPPTLGITRPVGHRPNGHKLSRPPMPQGLSTHRPKADQARPGGEANTKAAGHVPQPPQARGAYETERIRSSRPGMPL